MTAPLDARQELVVERVLRCVELVPAGRVASYGTIGKMCGVGPRQVGRIMQRYGSDVAWWRIVSAAGELPPPLLKRALPRWEAEGIVLQPHGRGCSYRTFAVDAGALERAWRAATADLPSPEP